MHLKSKRKSTRSPEEVRHNNDVPRPRRGDEERKQESDWIIPNNAGATINHHLGFMTNSASILARSSRSRSQSCVSAMSTLNNGHDQASQWPSNLCLIPRQESRPRHGTMLAGQFMRGL